MSTVVVRIDRNKLSSLKKFIKATNGSFHLVRDAEMEEVLEDRWLSKMIDEAEKEKGEISRETMSKKFAKDGISF